VTRTLVLVEDEDDIREIAQMALEMHGFTVFAVDHGRAGVEKVRAVRPDAVVLDVMMPGLDGPGTLAELRADPELSGIPVLFLTAKTQAREVEQLLGHGAAGVLRKPFDPLRLGELVTRALGW
jgi:DNA-binding response OmpR family regulator